MNIGKSTKICLATQEKDINWLSSQLKVKYQRASKIANTEDCGMGTIMRVARAFNMPVSEFIALGE
jgi:hypothetical protein